MEREESVAGRDIGEIPEIRDPKRRESCRLDLRLFLETYFPQSFTLAWSADHRELIKSIQYAALEGGLLAVGMPRGSGKTTINERAGIWTVFYGFSPFVPLIGATGPAASEMFDSVRSELETNELLAEDFPEICYPIQCLEGIAQRRLIYKGKLVRMAMRNGRIVLPNLPGSVAAGGIIGTASMTARIRGMKFKRPDGAIARPSFFLLDDPQTDESAMSQTQCESLERIIGGAVIGLAGPGKKISGVMSCTVIRKGDVADRYLDHKIHPEWAGKRFKMVYSFPTAVKLWDEYGSIYMEGRRLQDGNASANAFYQTHREEMDAGSRVAWEARVKPDELSAIQHAMNLKISNERAFAAEYQNDPLPEIEVSVGQLTAQQIAERFNRIPRGMAPVESLKLTAGIDVQGELLYWTVCAWGDEFSGSVVDYGTWPEQNREYFTLRDATVTLSSSFPSLGMEGKLYAGLNALSDSLLGREWPKAGGVLRVQRCLVDANWGDATNLVYKFTREAKHSAILTPSHGKFYGASSPPIHDGSRKVGEDRGLEWVVRTGDGRGIQHCTFNSNFWKSFVHSRLATAPGDKGALTLFGDSVKTHRMFADHCCAESWVPVEARGRKVNEWKARPGQDNHWWDCLVMAAVAASMSRVNLKEAGGPAPPVKRKKVKWSEVAASKAASFARAS